MVRITDCPDMTSAVYRGHEAIIIQIYFDLNIVSYVLRPVLFYMFYMSHLVLLLCYSVHIDPYYDLRLTLKI